MMWRAMILVPISMAASAAVAAMQAPAAPASDRWVMEVSLGKCRLMRSLAADKAGLAIETDVGTDDYMLTLAHKTATRVPEEFSISARIKVDGRVLSKAE